MAQPRIVPEERDLNLLSPAQKIPASGETIQSLTGLRFYAAFGVFLSHLYHFNYFGLPDPWRTMVADLGWLGVSVFYVLSGFVLFLRYRDGLPSIGQLKSFYVARIARIYPVFLVTALLATPIEFFSSHRDQFLLTLGTNATLTHCMLPQTCGRLNDVGWSVGIEAAFYAIFPLLLLGISNFKRLAFALGALFLSMYSLALFSPDSFYAGSRFFINRIPEFLSGILVGWLYIKQNKPCAFGKKGLCLAITLLCGGLFLTPLLLQAVSLQEYHYLFYILPSAALIYLLAAFERARVSLALFASSLAVYGGEISYSFYLIHNLLLRYMEHGLAIVAHIDIKTASLSLQCGLAVLALLGSLGGAILLYHVVEKPCRKKVRAFFS